MLDNVVDTLELDKSRATSKLSSIREVRRYLEEFTSDDDRKKRLDAVEALCSIPKLESLESEGEERDAITILQESLSKTVLKKEFRISGTIGTPSRTDKSYLSYISLIHQIDSARKMKYSEEEIISGVIKAMSPGLKLRTVIETLPNLKLPRLRLMLHSHYNEKAASELFQELSNCAQHEVEEADEFLMRAYEIRQKLIFASNEVGCTVKYDVSLIQSVYLNSIETGILSESIRNRMRPYLSPPQSGDTVEDFEIRNDELIHQMNLSVSLDVERRNKLVKGSTTKKTVAFAA